LIVVTTAIQGVSVDEIEVPDVTRCPQCGGEGRLLGKLGALVWRRCRNCGAEWNDTGTIHEEAPR